MLKAKGSAVWTISKDAPVSDALKIFVERRISSVIAMDGEKVAGIFTERDFAHKVGLFGKNPAVVKLEEVIPRTSLRSILANRSMFA